MAERFRVDPDKVVHETIEGEAILIHLDNGYYYSLDGAGAEIWGLLAESRSVDETVAALARVYESDDLGAEVRRIADELVGREPPRADRPRSRRGAERRLAGRAARIHRAGAEEIRGYAGLSSRRPHPRDERSRVARDASRTPEPGSGLLRRGTRRGRGGRRARGRLDRARPAHRRRGAAPSLRRAGAPRRVLRAALPPRGRLGRGSGHDLAVRLGHDRHGRSRRFRGAARASTRAATSASRSATGSPRTTSSTSARSRCSTRPRRRASTGSSPRGSSPGTSSARRCARRST